MLNGVLGRGMLPRWDGVRTVAAPGVVRGMGDGVCAAGYLFHKADLLLWLIISLILFFYTCNIVLFTTAKLAMFYQSCKRDAVFFKPKSVDGIYLFEISDGEISYLSTWYATKRKPLRGRDIPHALHDSAGAP